MREIQDNYKRTMRAAVFRVLAVGRDLYLSATRARAVPPNPYR